MSRVVSGCVVSGRVVTGRILRQVAAIAITIALAGGAAAQQPVGQEPIAVVLDHAKVMRLPAGVATIIVGNPLIADATVQAGSLMVVTGKGYGVTNLMLLDAKGQTLGEHQVRVSGPREGVVTVYRGIERETFACAPRCERAVVLGDAPAHFDAALNQSGNRSSQAQGSTAAR